MQDYARLFDRPCLRPEEKLTLIRRVLRSRVAASLMVAAIALILEAGKRR
jgi:hypothetical protein